MVRTIRNQRHHCFIKLGDGSTLREVQAVLSPSQAEGVSTGAFVSVGGYWKPSPGAEQPYEIHVEEIVIDGPVDSAKYPLQKKYHTPDFLRTIPHLRLRSPFHGLITRVRSELEHYADSFFYEQHYIRATTPVITSTDCEGTGAVFAVHPRTAHAGAPSPAPTPAPPLSNTSSDTPADVSTPFFRGSDGTSGLRFLTSSAQLHLEAYMATHHGAWTLAPCFRAERSDTPRHLSEFAMLEVELRASQLLTVMADLRALLRHLATGLRSSPAGRELAAAGRHGGADEAARAARVQRRLDLLTRPGDWRAVPYRDAIAALCQAAEAGRARFRHAPSAAGGLGIEHERWLAQEVGRGGPLFVTHYPRVLKPFYMLPAAAAPHAEAPAPPAVDAGPDLGPTAACFDLLLPDLGEVAGGSLREHRLEPLLEAMRTRGLYPLAPEETSGADDDGSEGDSQEEIASGARGGSGNGPLDWYVDLRRYASIPHGGFGLGFDRLMAYLSGVDNVRDVVPWPRYHGRCDG